MVCDRVKFTLDNESGIILLPWSPGVYQEVELKAIGGWKPFPSSPIWSYKLILDVCFYAHWSFCDVGCAKTVSDFRWLSSDSSTVSVSAFGIAQAKKPGKATIKVLSVYDSLNYDEVMLLG